MPSASCGEEIRHFLSCCVCWAIRHSEVLLQIACSRGWARSLYAASVFSTERTSPELDLSWGGRRCIQPHSGAPRPEFNSRPLCAGARGSLAIPDGRPHPGGCLPPSGYSDCRCRLVDDSVGHASMYRRVRLWQQRRNLAALQTYQPARGRPCKGGQLRHRGQMLGLNQFSGSVVLYVSRLLLNGSQTQLSITFAWFCLRTVPHLVIIERGCSSPQTSRARRLYPGQRTPDPDSVGTGRSSTPSRAAGRLLRTTHGHLAMGRPLWPTDGRSLEAGSSHGA